MTKPTKAMSASLNVPLWLAGITAIQIVKVSSVAVVSLSIGRVCCDPFRDAVQCLLDRAEGEDPQGDEPVLE